MQMKQVHNSLIYRGAIGAEPGIDPRKPGADAAYAFNTRF